MLKEFIAKLLFRIRSLCGLPLASARRLDVMERQLEMLGARFDTADGIPPPVHEAIRKTGDTLTKSIRGTAAAIENARGVLQVLEAQMLELQLSHSDGTHRELYREIDELRARIEQLENCPAGVNAVNPSGSVAQ